MKLKITLFVAAIAVSSACGVMRDKTVKKDKALEMEWFASLESAVSGEDLVLPIDMSAKYQTPVLQEIPLCQGVTQGTLPNGLTYCIVNQDPFFGTYPKDAFFYLIQKTGSLEEDDDQLGVAHFVEHYAFNWTKNYPNFAAPNFIKKIGGGCNATTVFDYTTFHASRVTLDDNPQYADSCLLILRDIAANCNFEGDILERERKIILEEYRMRNASVYREYIGGIFEGTRYAERCPIGTVESIKQMTLDKLKDYYRKWYQPQNQALLVVGNVNVSEVEEKITKIFGDIPRGNSEVPVYEFSRTKHDTPRIVSLKNDQLEKGSLEIFFGSPDKELVRNRNTVAYYVEKDMRQFIRDIISRRLERIQREMMIFDDVTVSETSDMPTYDDAPFVVKVDFTPNNWQKVLTAVVQELEKLKRYGWIKNEKQGAFSDRDSTKSMKDSVVLATNSPSLYLCTISGLFSHLIYGEYLLGQDLIWPLYNYKQGRFCDGFAHDYFTKLAADSNTVAVLSLPGGADSSDIRKVYLSAQNSVDEDDKFEYAESPDYRRLIKNLNVDVKKSGKTASQRRSELFDATEFTFSNGVRALVCQRDDYFQFFSIDAVRPGALTNYSDEDAKKIELLNDVMATPFMSIDTDEIHAKYSVSNQGDDFLFKGTGTFLLPEMWLKYVYYRLTNMDIDSSRLENCKLKYANDYNTATPILSRMGQLLKESYHDEAYKKRNAPLSPQILQNITIDEMRELCKKYFANFNGTTFLIRSQFSPKYLKPLLEKYLGSLPSQPQPVSYVNTKADLYKDSDDSVCYRYKAEEPRTDIVVSYVLKDGVQYSQEREIVADAFSTILGDVLFENLRQSDGKVYALDYDCSFDGTSNLAQILYVCTSCQPQNARQLLDSIKSIISQMAYGNLVTESQLNAYVNYKYNDVIAHVNDFLGNDIIKNYYLNGCVDRRITDANLVRALTVEKVRDFAKELVDKGIRHEMIIEGQ